MKQPDPDKTIIQLRTDLETVTAERDAANARVKELEARKVARAVRPRCQHGVFGPCSLCTK